MQKIKDQQLIDELQKRFNENFKNLSDQNELIKQLETVNQKLKDSESLKTNFISNIKNEINNPITSVLGLAKILMDKGTNDPESIRKMAAHIYNDVANLNFQLNNIFAAAEIEAGEVQLEITEVNVEELIKNLIETCKIRSAPKNITITLISNRGKKGLKTPAPIHSFKTDAVKFHLILLNLLLNSIEFTQNEGKIIIDLKVNKRTLSIKFQDSGTGISEKEKKEIFNRFKQLSAGGKKSLKGHGLGLAVTKDLVELLQGTISFDSAENKGSAFTIIFKEFDFSSKSSLSGDDNELFLNHEKF